MEDLKMPLNFYKCGKCNYYFTSYFEQQVPCPECQIIVNMTTQETIEVQIRKQLFLNHELKPFTAYAKGTSPGV